MDSVTYNLIDRAVKAVCKSLDGLATAITDQTEMLKKGLSEDEASAVTDLRMTVLNLIEGVEPDADHGHLWSVLEEISILLNPNSPESDGQAS